MLFGYVRPVIEESIRKEPPAQSGASGPARFLYTSKASRSERTCDGKVDNDHPTVKPVEIMRYLVRLTKTPTGGVVLDPFGGSGSTA
ncbi:MAG: DNA methyltransferase, partial [Kiritimatiellia bacterium]